MIPPEPLSPGASVAELLAKYEAYQAARFEFLGHLSLAHSNRDPLAEFAEQLVAVWLGGILATSRVQKGHDLIDAAGRTVQVKYLANPPGRWVNEHHVIFTPTVDRYAIVMFEGLHFAGVVCFTRDTIADVCRLLGKRHPRQEFELQFTQTNWRRIMSEPTAFGQYGVEMLVPTSRSS